LEDRHALVAIFAVVASLAILQRMRTGKGVLAQKREQVDLALHLHLTLDLIDPDQELSLIRLDRVVAVDRAVRNGSDATDAAEGVILSEVFEEGFAQLGVNSHGGFGGAQI